MFKPLHALVAVLLDPKATRSKGGIEIPDTAQASHMIGTVRAAGPEAGYKIDGVEYRLKPGDRVLIGAQKDRSGHVVNFGTIPDDGIEVALVNYLDIWGTVDPEKTNG